MLLLFFCFKNLNLFDWQTTQLDFSLSTLFVIFTSCGLKLQVKSLHQKQYVVPGIFLIFIGFIFDCIFFVFCNLVKCFRQFTFCFYWVIWLANSSYFSTMESYTDLDLHWQFVCFFCNKRHCTDGLMINSIFYQLPN